MIIARKNLASHDADLSRWPEIKEKMGEADGVTYDQFVEMVGGVKMRIIYIFGASMASIITQPCILSRTKRQRMI